MVLLTELEYYNQIKNVIENYEVSNKVRVMQDNRDRLKTNWQIGKLLVDAQGGMSRAKYGDGLIKKWAVNLEIKYGKSYSARELRKMRQFYFLFPKWGSLSLFTSY